jgi:hypothetical protein
MRFLETFSKSIFKLVAGRSLQKIRTNSIESVLEKSVLMLDPSTLDEMRAFVLNSQTSTGGFADRGGKCDIYYSLFGCYIAEALGIHEVFPSLKHYVKNIALANNLKGIQRKSAAILYAKLNGSGTVPPVLQRPDNLQATYSDFINLLAYYYTEDYLSLFKVQRRLKTIETANDKPCSVTAAHLILHDCFRMPIKELENRLNEFYRGNGSFAALRRATSGDLLSTGVALYGLRFVNSDITMIKPDCLSYIDSLYSEGGFCATVSDPDRDVEYTFYGLLALGALSD